MKYPLVKLVLIATPLLLASFNLNAEAVAKVYPIKGVSELVVDGDTQVELVQDGTEYLRIDADADILARVRVDQTGRKLMIDVKNEGGFFGWFSQQNKRIRVTLRLKDLSYLELSGAAQLNTGPLRGEQLTLEASGAGEAKISALEYPVLKLGLSGASNAHVEQINGRELVCNISGASNLEIRSASQVEYLRADASGASNLQAKKMQVVKAHVEASGASYIAVSVSGELKAKASGASTVDYYGAPKADTDTSGASSVNAHSAQD